MRRRPWLIVLFVCSFACAAEKSPVDWVDPLIDTHASRYFYFNSACRPFGMVNLSPDTQTKGTWKSGYLYNDQHIRCFSHIHAWQLSGIPVMPITGAMTGHQGMDVYQSEFSHNDEIVQAGYHKVVLQTYDVTAELTSTIRVGFHRYTFPQDKDAYVLFDLGAYLAHGPMVFAEARRVSDIEIEGKSVMGKTNRRKKETPVYFVAQFNRPMLSFGAWQNKEQLLPDVREISGADAGVYVQVDPQQPLLMKVAISYTSVANARKNLKAELDHWDFNRVVRESRADWNSHLSRIQVEGGTDKQKTKFYTDLWRSLLGRRIVSDVDGSYLDMTNGPTVRRVPLSRNRKPAFPMYNHDAWWGSHWSLNILWPLLCPERYSDFCNTAVEMYRRGGKIPRGPSGGNYTFVMIGDHAAPALTAAYQKGIRDFDTKTALQGLVQNTGPQGGRYFGGYATESSPQAHDEYEQKGYLSWGNGVPGSHGKAVTSLTMYNAYHDWCIAQMAKSLGEEELYERFIKKADNYRNVIYPEKRCAWVRTRGGGWKSDFRPIDESFEQDGFCETSAAVTTFFVPHDPMGLAELCGGPVVLSQVLDGYFQAAEKKRFTAGAHSRIHANAYVDYANQDSTGMAHFFNRIGFPWLSQKWVRKVYALNYSGCDPYHGYNGDEDQGQMGAISALMAMGLFQFDGGSGPNSMYDLTAPVFDKVVIQLSEKYYGGNTLTIVTRNQGPDHVYIQSATWNGRSWNSACLPHAELMKGGALVLTLGAEPNKKWGKQ